MAIALKQAELAVSRGQTPFGAAVVDSGGQLMGEGHRSVRADLDPTTHGEIVAIRAAWRLETGRVCSARYARAWIQTAAGRRFEQGGGVVNAQPDWTPLDVEAEFMRDRALEILATFPWAQAQTRVMVK